MAITFGADKEVSLQDLVKTVSHMISQLDPDAAPGKTAKTEKGERTGRSRYGGYGSRCGNA